MAGGRMQIGVAGEYKTLNNWQDNLTPMDIRRFHSKYRKTDSCWEWIPPVSGHHYGQFWLMSAQRSVGAHRVSYRLHKGHLENGFMILHSCDNRICVNPDHLSQGTYRDNIDDMVNKKRQNYGEKHPKAKLSEETVKLIKGLYLGKWLRPQEIAKIFSIDESTVWDLANKKTWRHL